MQKGRKKKVRFIQKLPEVNQFSPRGRPGRPDEVVLRLDHYEAVKLADYQGYSQAEGAKMMKLSRPTFGRILREARALIADSIVNGKTIRINFSSIQVGILRKDIPKKDEIVSGFAREKIIREHIIKYDR